MSKQEMRRRMAALSFSEKVKILEQLRDRSAEFALVHVTLSSRATGLNSEHEGQRERLQAEAQKYLSAYLKGGVPNASTIHALLRAWLEGFGQVRFELSMNGHVRSAGVSSVDELRELLGNGQTPASFLRALSQKMSSSE